MEADLERNFLETGIDASKVTLKVVSNFWNSLLSSPIWTKLSKSRNAQNTRTKGTRNFLGGVSKTWPQFSLNSDTTHTTRKAPPVTWR